MTNRIKASMLGAVLAAVVLSPALATAETAEVTVDRRRLTVGQLFVAAPEEHAEASLGAAPTPGASRLFQPDELRRALDRAGVPGGAVTVDGPLRVRSAVRVLSPAEVAAFVRSSVLAELKAGVALDAIEARRSARISPRAIVGSVQVPKPPRRVGPHHSSAVVTLLHDGEVSGRVVVGLRLTVGEAALRYEVEQGAAVQLVIERGRARITARGEALQSGDRGDVVGFRVLRTRKVLRARIVDGRTAKVVGS